MIKRMKVFCFFLSRKNTLFAAAAAAPLLPAAHVTTVTPQAGYYNEPAAAIDPSDPRRMAVAWQIRGDVAYSTDGGANWARSPDHLLRGYRIEGDTQLGFDAHGHLYACNIAFDRLGRANYWAQGATRNAILVWHSDDGGRSWPAPAAAVIAQRTAPRIPFEDKPGLVVDDTGSTFSGNLYVGWTEFTLADSRILFARSTDGGRSFSAPLKISVHDGVPRDDEGAVEGFAGAVDTDGTLYATWADGGNLLITSSSDGGKSFSPPRVAVTIPASYYSIAGVDRANGFPSLAVDRHRHRLVLAWADYRNGGVDAFVAISADHGATWSAPFRVNDDALHDGGDHFFPALAVDASDGSYDLLFYDRRGDTKDPRIRAALARSTDGGASFSNRFFAAPAFDPKGDFIGDYLALSAGSGRVLAAWAQEPAPGTKLVRSKSGKPDKVRLQIDVGVVDFSLGPAEPAAPPPPQARTSPQ